MGFEFTLEGLLRVRESFEKQAELKLAVASGQLKRLEAMLALAREQLTSTDNRLGELLAQGATGCDLHLLCLEKAILERREQSLAESVAAALTEVQKLRARLQEAQQKRKILDRLRQKQLSRFLLIESRRGQQEIDDAFLSRRYLVGNGKDLA